MPFIPNHESVVRLIEGMIRSDHQHGVTRAATTTFPVERIEPTTIDHATMKTSFINRTQLAPCAAAPSPNCSKFSRSAFSRRPIRYMAKATPPARLNIIPIMKRIEYM